MLIVFIAFIIFLIVGMPIAFAVGISGALFFVQHSNLPATIMVQMPLTQAQNFALLAVPLFIFAGNLLNCGGTTDRLAKFAGILTGRMRGGYAQTSVVLSTMMGGVSRLGYCGRGHGSAPSGRRHEESGLFQGIHCLQHCLYRIDYGDGSARKRHDHLRHDGQRFHRQTLYHGTGRRPVHDAGDDVHDVDDRRDSRIQAGQNRKSEAARSVGSVQRVLLGAALPGHFVGGHPRGSVYAL